MVEGWSGDGSGDVGSCLAFKPCAVTICPWLGACLSLRLPARPYAHSRVDAYPSSYPSACPYACK